MSVMVAPAALDGALEEGRAALFGGDPERAARLFEDFAEARPGDANSRYWLYSALMAARRPDEAQLMLEAARTLHAVDIIRAAGADMARFQTDRAYCAEIGQLFYASKLMGAASVCLGRSLDFENLNPQHMVSYGLSLQHQGRLDEAVAVFSAAAEAFQHPDVHAFLLHPVFYARDRLKRVSDETRKWGERYAAPKTPAKPVFSNARTANRRLRIGYLGPSFTRNQVAQFLLPVLESHDRGAFDVHLYCANPQGEADLPAGCEVTAIGGLSDADVAARIRADGIDILVDVWGHTAGSRLGVFGLRPAPIQVAWINFVQTTGLACMDYILHADSMELAGDDAFFTEAIWRIGPIVAPSRPAADRPDPVSTPALRNGYVIYGSFNNPAKLSESSVAAWAMILRARPADRLVLKYSYFEDPVLQRATQARFAAYGVQPEQIEFRGHSTGADYWRAFQEIDLALDPSPCPGGTTSCDALANGVPVLTQWGDDFYSRIGVPVVLPCGLPELIADGWEDYVAKALALTADHRALDALRARVRPAFDASPYRDEVGFTRNLEAVFRQMFARWLAADQ